MTTTPPRIASIDRPQRDFEWVSLVALASGILMVAAIGAVHDQVVMANFEAAIAVALAVVGLWIARLRISARYGRSGPLVGYGLVAFLALLAIPGPLPAAAYHWGYLTFLGAAFVVLGLRSRQHLTWMSGLVTVIVGVLTGSSVVRASVLGLREGSVSMGPSLSAQFALGISIVALAVWSRAQGVADR